MIYYAIIVILLEACFKLMRAIQIAEEGKPFEAAAYFIILIILKAPYYILACLGALAFS